MQIKILKKGDNLEGMLMVKCEWAEKDAVENFEEKLSASLGSALEAAIKNGGLKLAIDMGSFVTSGGNHSYVVNEAIECVAELVDKGVVLQDFKLYFVDALIPESKYAALYKDKLSDAVEEVQSFGDVDDDLFPRFEEFNAAVKKGKSFGVCLGGFMLRSGIESNAKLCERSGISKSVASRIMTKNVIPARETIAALCIGLRLNLDEAQELYNSA